MRTVAHHISYGRVPSVASRAKSRRSWGPVEAFVVFQFGCQIVLLFESFGAFRILLRSISFGASLLLLIVLPRGKGRSHPATHAAYWAMAILVLSFFHPTTNSTAAALVQIGIYLAILGPLFWVPRLEIDLAALRRLLLIIFIFHTISAAVGVMQARYPGSFQPSLSTTLAAKERAYIEGLKITLANGQRVFRPMGLTDIPGGAASAGAYTVLLGMGFFLTARRRWMRVTCVGSIIVGLMCIYLSQVRSIMIITGVCMLALSAFLVWQRRTAKFIVLGTVLVTAIALSFSFAVNLGGREVTRRMSTLVEDDPSAVYYKHRGIYLEDTATVLLPQYPLGAGLGRWGMANFYFGDNTDPDRAPIYAEIQWTAWLLDGGVPLILAYLAVLFIGVRVVLRIALNRSGGELPIWGAVVAAYSAGVLATIFNYPLFTSQGGMEFWLINAALFAAGRQFILPVIPLKRPQR